MLGIFNGKGTIKGAIEIRQKPNCKMYSVSMSLFPIASHESPLPHGGQPPAESYKDEVSIRELDDNDSAPLTFEIKRPAGYYYLDIGVIAYIEKDGRMFAQVEHFFPLTEPINVRRKQVHSIQLIVDWPDIPFDELGSYGTIKPGGKGKLYDV